MAAVARPAAGPPGPLHGSQFLLLGTILLGTFTGAINTTVLAPAFATIGAEFAVDVRDLSWIFTIYILVSVVAVPLMAKLSDMYGRRPVYLACMAILSIGSIMAALAPGYGWLLLARGVQAFGGGGVAPVASAVIGDVLPRERQGFALGLTGTVWSVAGIIGPFVGGVLVQQVDWRWIFIINLPIAAFVMLAGLTTLPGRTNRKTPPFDFAGLILLSCSLISLIYGLSQLDVRLPLLGLATPERAGFLVLALVLFVPWVIIERRIEYPFFDLKLLRRQQLVLTYVLGVGGSILLVSRLFIPPMLETVYGADPQTAGLITGLAAVAVMAGTPVAGWLLDRAGPRSVLIVGGFITASGLAALALLAQDVVMATVTLMVSGVGLSAVLGAPLRYMIIGETQPQERGIANAVYNILNNVGSAVSVALTGAVVASAALPADGYRWAYMVFAGVSVLALVLSFGVRRKTA